MPLKFFDSSEVPALHEVWWLKTVPQISIPTAFVLTAKSTFILRGVYFGSSIHICSKSRALHMTEWVDHNVFSS